ncbi:hypothetical protein I5907_01460 [Panacibacter sp. DH6]|uniref:DUF445 family protein n=1 Tax=Panacibacter microcysteis TaxID=2793269 RepID=A0A931E3H8_9BACT|nr:hypothetical protein [Panacibacter microcysteis]MBG9374886.1 hypothetical protein [Panacibacter microcysteis]
MNNALFLVPLIAALASWLMIRISIRSIFWKNGLLARVKGPLAASIASALNKEILNSSLLTQQLTSEKTLENAMPVIETHTDHFLNHKLKEAIPVISMFVGEKIISQLKELFLQELKELFPSVMSQFIGNLSQSGSLEQEIVLKLHTISISASRQLFYRRFGQSIRNIEFIFAAAGLVAGFIQLAITLLILA